MVISVRINIDSTAHARSRRTSPCCTVVESLAHWRVAHEINHTDFRRGPRCSTTARRPASAQDAKAHGEQLYTEQKCSLCHAIGGRGNVKGALDGVGSKLSAEDIRQWLTDAKGMTAKTKATRKPEMKQYTLAKDEVDAVVAYLQSLKAK
jgi:mono/diheme cytochrome c family protein